MSNANFSHGMQSKMARTVGVMLVLILLLSGGAPEAAAGLWVKRDWSRVQIVTPGTRTKVLLYKDRAPGGLRKIEGNFKSATPEAITLSLPGGNPYTLQKQDVLKVLVDRPPYEGWITAGASTGVFAGLAPGWDLNGRGWALFGGLFVGVPTVVAFLVAPKMGSIYYVPPDRRDPANTKTTPPKQRSNNTVPAVAKPSKGPVGSRKEGNFLVQEHDLDRYRQQARQRLMRKGLPLDLSSLPMHGAQAGID